jgi:hypothetical protein
MSVDYLKIERALSSILPFDQLNVDEKDFCQSYKPVFEVGLLARRMAQGYYAHSAAMMVAKDLRSDDLTRHPLENRFGVSIPVRAFVPRKDGTLHHYDAVHYLNDARSNPPVVDELPRVWLVGSLLSVGDALAMLSRHLRPPRYLDGNPTLELLYHLRNGIAHGNKFHFFKPGKERLNKYPAHNKTAGVKSGKKAEFEIGFGLQGQPVLFEFVGPGDVLDLLQSVEVYLTRIRERHAAGELSGLLQAVVTPRNGRSRTNGGGCTIR